jgi:hypothetical protein
MRSRWPVLIALALVLCALPSVQAFAAAACAPCCAEQGAPASGSDCGLSDSACCDLAPVAPIAAVEHAMPQLAAPAAISAPLVLAPAPAQPFFSLCARALAATSPPGPLSMVRRL